MRCQISCRVVLNLYCDGKGACTQQLKFRPLLRQASFDELALKVRKFSLKKASVAGNVVRWVRKRANRSSSIVMITPKWEE